MFYIVKGEARRLAAERVPQTNLRARLPDNLKKTRGRRRYAAEKSGFLRLIYCGVQPVRNKREGSEATTANTGKQPMNMQAQITKHLTSQPEPKRSDMQALHRIILRAMPGCKLWFSDGKDSDNRTVANPTIGYGSRTIKYADGKTKESFQVGLSANKTGISVYILGLEDKKYLAKTYGKKLGKASVTGYCIRFKTLTDVDTDTLQAAIRYGVKASA